MTLMFKSSGCGSGGCGDGEGSVQVQSLLLRTGRGSRFESFAPFWFSIIGRCANSGGALPSAS